MTYHAKKQQQFFPLENKILYHLGISTSPTSENSDIQCLERISIHDAMPEDSHNSSRKILVLLLYKLLSELTLFILTIFIIL
jgi:hypothetical protein